MWPSNYREWKGTCPGDWQNGSVIRVDIQRRKVCAVQNRLLKFSLYQNTPDCRIFLNCLFQFTEQRSQNKLQHLCKAKSEMQAPLFLRERSFQSEQRRSSKQLARWKSFRNRKRWYRQSYVSTWRLFHREEYERKVPSSIWRHYQKRSLWSGWRQSCVYLLA